jgi:uncharacterized protein
MSRIIAALFLCLAFAPLARAQSLDCAGASGLMQRVCEAPELVALEEERRALIGELQFIDPAHPAIQSEASFLASQEACADAGCLIAGYAEHNQTLRSTLDAIRPPDAELLPEPEAPPPAPERSERSDEPAATQRDAAAADQFSDYLATIIIWLVTLLIALWLVSAAARARRGE